MGGVKFRIPVSWSKSCFFLLSHVFKLSGAPLLNQFINDLYLFIYSYRAHPMHIQISNVYVRTTPSNEDVYIYNWISSIVSPCLTGNRCFISRRTLGVTGNVMMRHHEGNCSSSNCWPYFCLLQKFTANFLAFYTFNKLVLVCTTLIEKWSMLMHWDRSQKNTFWFEF